MKGFAFLCLLAASAPLGADYAHLTGPDWTSGQPRSSSALQPNPSGILGLRAPAYPDWVAPTSPAPAWNQQGLNAIWHFPGVAKDVLLAAEVEDRYDWFPTYGTNADRDRPWLRVGSEWAFPRTNRQVSAGIGAAIPLVSATSGMPPEDPVPLEASARSQVGIYVKVRF